MGSFFLFLIAALPLISTAVYVLGGNKILAAIGYAVFSILWTVTGMTSLVTETGLFLDILITTGIQPAKEIYWLLVVLLAASALAVSLFMAYKAGEEAQS